MSTTHIHSQIVDRVVTDDHWRDTTYERPDGSQFHVAIPATTKMTNGYAGALVYDETAEANMLLQLAGPPRP